MKTEQIMVKMTLDRWNAQIKNLDSLLESLSDEHLQKEIAPGRNRGIYLLGHLVAVHDDMYKLVNFGEKMYPEMADTFIKSPDKAVKDLPTPKELREKLAKQNEAMSKKIDAMQTGEWFEKHNSVSAEDFANEPHRNKLNIIVTRTSHLSYHLGQMILLKS